MSIRVYLHVPVCVSVRRRACARKSVQNCFVHVKTIVSTTVYVCTEVHTSTLCKCVSTCVNLCRIVSVCVSVCGCSCAHARVCVRSCRCACGRQENDRVEPWDKKVANQSTRNRECYEMYRMAWSAISVRGAVVTDHRFQVHKKVLSARRRQDRLSNARRWHRGPTGTPCLSAQI